jgi:hypothetical protein
MSRVFGPSGVRGIDVTTERGTTKYDADKNGFINIDNPKHLRQAVSEGMAIASDFSGINAAGFPCPCGFNSVFRKCSRCGATN